MKKQGAKPAFQKTAPKDFISFSKVGKGYQSGDIHIDALKNVTFQIQQGEIAVIVGPSASGKSTLLNLLGAMDRCDSGEIWVDGQEISSFTPQQAASYRRQRIGFVFQAYHLMENLTAQENVEIAGKISKNPKYIVDILQKVGLSQRKNHFPAQLSGGEQQRVAIARALVKTPKLLLCDEPTGALDYETGREILQVIQDIAHLQDMTVVLITHNSAITPMADLVLHMKSGQIWGTDYNDNPTPIEKIHW